MDPLAPVEKEIIKSCTQRNDEENDKDNDYDNDEHNDDDNDEDDDNDDDDDDDNDDDNDNDNCPTSWWRTRTSRCRGCTQITITTEQTSLII